jgi:hypothetical protein
LVQVALVLRVLMDCKETTVLTLSLVLLPLRVAAVVALVSHHKHLEVMVALAVVVAAVMIRQVGLVVLEFQDKVLQEALAMLVLALLRQGVEAAQVLLVEMERAVLRLMLEVLAVLEPRQALLDLP